MFRLLTPADPGHRTPAPPNALGSIVPRRVSVSPSVSFRPSAEISVPSTETRNVAFGFSTPVSTWCESSGVDTPLTCLKNWNMTCVADCVVRHARNEYPVFVRGSYLM